MRALHVFTIPGTAEAFFDGQFAYLSEHGHDITVAANEKLNDSFSARNHVKSKTFSIARRIAPLEDLRTIAALRREIRQSGYDIVVGHTPKGAMVAMIASLLAGTKKRVYYRHGLIYTTATGLKRIILKTVERLTALCASHIINVSPSVNALAIKDCLNPASKQTVIGAGTCGGIDTRRLFNPALVSESDIATLRQQFGISSHDYVVGFCGRLCRDKGIIELLNGFDLFKRRHPDITARLLLIGRFDDRDTLPEEIKRKITNSEDIISTGSVDHSLLPGHYSLMDVFVFPSYREGFGMSVIEASAMQIPILVSRSHGCIDSIREHQTGEYIALSAESICQGLEKMQDSRLRETLGATGRRFVTQNFDHTVLWPKIQDFYNNISNKICNG